MSFQIWQAFPMPQVRAMLGQRPTVPQPMPPSAAFGAC